jgi:hypothetical protein
MFSKSHKHTHTHTHTHTKKESERMVSVQSCGVSHHSLGGAPCFSEGRRSGCTNFLQFLGQWQLFLKWDNQWGWQILLSLPYGCFLPFLLRSFQFMTVVVSSKFSKCICLHFVASCTKTWFWSDSYIFLCLPVHQTDHPEHNRVWNTLLKLHSFYFHFMYWFHLNTTIFCRHFHTRWADT